MRKRRHDYCQGDTDVHMGVTLANVCRDFLCILAADMCIARVRVGPVGVELSIAEGVLVFLWG